MPFGFVFGLTSIDSRECVFDYHRLVGLLLKSMKDKYIVNTIARGTTSTFINTTTSPTSSKKPIPILHKEDGRNKLDYGGASCSTSNDVENNNNGSIKHMGEQLRYPIAVIFVLGSKFFEAFAANGVRTILALYMRDSLHFSEEFATAILHIFNFFSQFCPIFGAVLADSYIGNPKTIFYFFIPYAVGYIGITVATLPFEKFSAQTLAFIALLLIGVGNGNLRACITTLGGNQFTLPEQKTHLEKYFSHYYFVYTLGILLSKIVPPSVRSAIHCFGAHDCYTAVFGMILTIFIASWIVFLIGMFFYREETPNNENVLLQVIGCVAHGISNKIKGRARLCNNWLDSTVDQYSESFVRDVSAFLKVLKLFIPLPIYWSLLAQQDSSWTFQATQLNTRVHGIYIEPDQVKAMGPIILLLQILFWQRIVLPFFQRNNIILCPLNSVAYGGLCAALSFVCAGLLQISIEMNHRPSVLWQVPQFFLIMMGELLLAIPGLQFSFTQAPQTMKSVLTAAWFINNAIGNLIVVVITELPPCDKQSSEFFFYAVLMLLAILYFTYLASRYKYASRSEQVIASSEQTIESFIYVEDVQTTNLDKNNL